MALSLSRISSVTELESSCDFGLSAAKSSAHFLTYSQGHLMSQGTSQAFEVHETYFLTEVSKQI